MVSLLNQVIRRSASKAFQEKGGRVSAEVIFVMMEQDYPDEVQLEKERLYKSGAIARITQFICQHYCRDEDEADDGGDGRVFPQLDLLPGLPAPAAIAVREEGGRYSYVLLEVATWADLNAALDERQDNIEHATIRRNDWLAKMRHLEPAMRSHPRMTVKEAIIELAKEPVR